MKNRSTLTVWLFGGCLISAACANSLFAIEPQTAQSIALSIDVKNPEKSIRVERREIGKYIFDSKQPPLVLRVKGRRLPEWKLDEFQNAGPVPPSPAESSEPLQELKLIPYGAAKLRVTILPLFSFPETSSGRTSEREE